ncbi:MAG: stage II sporulation protein M [Deltaproteobacteria bacterium]|nr:stage II sporulation protein M [Deltaproteobacteria bacterium]
MRTAGFDVERFLRDREKHWHELESMLFQVERSGTRALGIEGARKFAKLYRQVSADLVRARTELVDASIQDYLNDLVARAYRHVYAGTVGSGWGVLRFFAQEFPALVRAERRAVALSAALFFLGGIVGAAGMALDPNASAVLVPEQHQATTPTERIQEEERSDGHASDEAAAFSSFLFTHNIQVSFLVFAMGITFGIGTTALMFYNGVPLGALAWQYHAAGHGLFFWAWILPHGIPEISEIVIAGAAGLILARGLLWPGRRSRRDALVHEAKIAVRLVVGGMPVLVLAGLIEGTISQMHAPLMPYWAKLIFAVVVGTALFTWLARAGRSLEREEPAARA